MDDLEMIDMIMDWMQQKGVSVWPSDSWDLSDHKDRPHGAKWFLEQMVDLEEFAVGWLKDHDG